MKPSSRYVKIVSVNESGETGFLGYRDNIRPKTVRPAFARNSLKTPVQTSLRQRAQKLYATRQERKLDKAEDDVSKEEAKSPGLFAAGAAQFGTLVNSLLLGAASRIERGTSVCVACKGTGTMICKDCKATGVIDVPASRSTGSSLKHIVGTRNKEKEWIVSNRCRKCRGHGRLECPQCNGIGKRFVVQPTDW